MNLLKILLIIFLCGCSILPDVSNSSNYDTADKVVAFSNYLVSSYSNKLVGKSKREILSIMGAPRRRDRVDEKHKSLSIFHNEIVFLNGLIQKVDSKTQIEITETWNYTIMSKDFSHYEISNVDTNNQFSLALYFNNENLVLIR